MIERGKYIGRRVDKSTEANAGDMELARTWAIRVNIKPSGLHRHPQRKGSH
jgi:hypothetical protein